MSEGKELKALAETLTLNKKSVWEKATPEQKDEIFAVGEEYKRFLDNCKTERETVSHLTDLAYEHGFEEIAEAARAGMHPGSKFFKVYRNKALILGILGTEELARGIRLVGAHVDSPRLDLKPSPLYQKKELALFKTHYYGGIKKYQWTAIPLALHGVVLLENGEKISVTIGEDEADPVFTITDVLPHLAKEQSKRRLPEGIKGEELNVLVGSFSLEGEGYKEKVKLAVLKFLHEKYGMVEEDFISAELEMVPAGKTRDVGFDRSLIGGYGQDDRICAFASWKALEAVSAPAKTAVALFADKEEIGSSGNTGMQSMMLQEVLTYLLEGKEDCISPAEIFYASEALSADVNAAIDPTWDEVMDSRNAARLGGGICLTKYTGSRGKADANDANAEYVASIRQLFNKNGIVWQSGEMGKVDEGGGGTIAKFLANLNMSVVDCGMPVLSMHAPFEISSKADLYMGLKAYTVFLQGV